MLSLALLLILPLFRLTAFAGQRSPVWPHGVVRVFDASGMSETVATAAARWNGSGAGVHFEVVGSRRRADVIVISDDRDLFHRCGHDCLGFSTSIGRAPHGVNTVILRNSLGGPPRPLSVWVAAHELGHVIGLHHRSGHDCSVMSPRAFDTRCAPSLAPQPADDGRAGVRAGAVGRRRRGEHVRRRRSDPRSAV